MISGKLRVLPVLTALFVTSPALAGDDFYGANLEGIGRAAVAHPDDNTTLSTNPGVIGLAERYTVGAHFGLGPTGDLEWALSAVDSKTAPPVAFGIAWRRTVTEPDLTLDEMPGFIEPGVEIPNRKRTHEITAALAAPILDRKLSFGVNGTVVLRNDDRGGKAVTGNLDVGAGWAIDERWTVGVAGRNLVPLPKQGDLYAGVTAGVHFIEEYVVEWGLDLDWQTSGDPVFPVSFRGGAELLVSAFRPRLGYRYEGADDVHWVVPSVGGANEAGAVDYSLALPVSGAFHVNKAVHTFSIRIRL